MRYRLPVMLRPLLASIALVSVAAACGPKVPTHNGYKQKRTKPWKKAKAVALDEANEAEIDGKVNWAKRRRARWYALTISDYGDLDIKMRSEQIGGEESEEEFDLAFELLNPAGKVLIVADKEEDDAGEEEKSRQLAELEPGTYWIHVYLQDRMQAGSFTLRLKFEPTQAPDESTFPAEVDYVGSLAAVPPVDDAPPPIAVKPKCRGKKCKKPKKPPKPGTKSLRARLVGVKATPSGRVAITLGIGSNRGVTKGARGHVITSGGSRIQGGSFKVSRVTGTRAYASVKASVDSVNKAKYATVKAAPPAAPPAP